MTPAESQTQVKRREALRLLTKRCFPVNTAALLDEGRIPAYAAVSKGPDGYWVSLHESEEDALSFFAQDNFAYAPCLFVDLDSDENRPILTETHYHIVSSAELEASYLRKTYSTP
jgi:hypothetical protein